MKFSQTEREAAFWAKVAPANERGCRLWLAAKNPGGYGNFWDGTMMVKAQRYAWFLHHGTYPSADCCHECDTPACVEVSHLFDGTEQQNMDDMVMKGRKSKRVSREMVRLMRRSEFGPRRWGLVMGISTGYASHIQHAERQRQVQ